MPLTTKLSDHWPTVTLGGKIDMRKPERNGAAERASGSLERMVRRPLYLTHTVSCSGEGNLQVISVKCESILSRVPITDEVLKQKLSKLAGFTPADGFSHVVQQIRKGRTYLIRRGRREQVEFADAERRRSGTAQTTMTLEEARKLIEHANPPLPASTCSVSPDWDLATTHVELAIEALSRRKSEAIQLITIRHLQAAIDALLTVSPFGSADAGSQQRVARARPGCSKPGCGYPDGKPCIGCGRVVKRPNT